MSHNNNNNNTSSLSTSTNQSTQNLLTSQPAALNVLLFTTNIINIINTDNISNINQQKYDIHIDITKVIQHDTSNKIGRSVYQCDVYNINNPNHKTICALKLYDSYDECKCEILHYNILNKLQQQCKPQLMYYYIIDITDKSHVYINIQDNSISELRYHYSIITYWIDGSTVINTLEQYNQLQNILVMLYRFGIVHHDIRKQNIIVDRYNKVDLID